MCGICGKIYFDEERTVPTDELRRMSRTLVHRGPDGEGVWTDGNVGLAHRRLSIIDLRPEAGQPMCNEDGTVWITFNGEIYNFQELRADLQARGHVFRTNSDTEVIVHAYEQYGRECLDHLRGMFAFAIWDTRSRTLFLARDRVGKKPLYYFADGERFIFASEVKAIFADPFVPRKPDPTAIDHFLALGYVPAPLAAFRGVRKLPAAHWLELRNGCLQIGRYWKLQYLPKRKISFADAAAELQWRFAEAVRLRLVSDVPLGAFLSGGIDSSAVVAFMARGTNRPVRTFSVGFEDEGFDERPFARLVADRYGTEHTELVVEAPVREVLPRVVSYYDEPLGDPSIVPSYAIAEVTRKYVTVVLNGDGGDENFAGYNRYITDCLFGRADAIPRGVRQSLLATIRLLPSDWRKRIPMSKIAKLAELAGLQSGRRYARWFGHFTPEQRESLYTADFRAEMTESDPEMRFMEKFAQHGNGHRVDTILDVDVSLYLADDLLVKMDRASMAHSLEARSPFLDHVFMEFVASLPANMKLKQKQTKRVLKAAMRGVVPDTVLDRPKMGFGAPIAKWLRNELYEMTGDILLSSRALQRGYFHPKAVTVLFKEHCEAQRDHAELLWDLLIMELWHRTYVDNGQMATAELPSAVANL
jgi:asparagine synthase (glutamine-hydrolysing)